MDIGKNFELLGSLDTLGGKLGDLGQSLCMWRILTCMSVSVERKGAWHPGRGDEAQPVTRTRLSALLQDMSSL